MHVALVTRSAEHRPIDIARVELWRNRHMVLPAGDGGPHEDLCVHPVQDEDAAVAAPQQSDPQVAVWQVKARWRDAIRSGRDRSELELIMALENAEEGRLPVVCAEAPKESGVDEDASPTLADGGGAGEGGRLRGEAEEDLLEEVVVLEHLGYRRH